MEKVFLGLAVGLGVIILAGGISLLLAWPIMWCWNYAVVSIWALPALTWGKAWCLSFLANCLIKSTLTTTNS